MHTVWIKKLGTEIIFDGGFETFERSALSNFGWKLIKIGGGDVGIGTIVYRSSEKVLLVGSKVVAVVDTGF